jgi:hypothetical protein
MNKEKFRSLMEDLYTIYNPDHLKYLDQLTEKYSIMPTEAVEMVLMKHNHPSFDHYDPDKNNMKYYQLLISSYTMGQRILQNVNVAQEVSEKRSQEIEEAEKSQQEKARLADEARREAEKKMSELKSDTEKKLESVNKKQQEFIKKLEKQLLDIQKKIETPATITEVKAPREWEDDVEVIIKVDLKEDLILPNAKFLTKLGIGARVVTSNKEGKPVGLMIKDILFDNTSIDIIGKPEVIIVLEKA